MSYMVPGYKVESLIKEGGFGEVYVAVRIKDKKKLAIKVLNEKGCKDIRAKLLFNREAKFLKSLNHPYIIKFDCLIAESRRPAIAIEYFESETLKSWILHKNPLLVKKGISVFIKLVESLLFLHQQKIIHKDIKPENILVDNNGDIRLIDFSIAEKMSFLNKFLPKKMEGTPLYMSPEQIRKETLDERCDIYSLGACFYEVFAGTPHAQGKSEKAILAKHLKGTVPKIRQYNKNIPYKLENVIMRMIEKDKKARYNNMKDVLYETKKAVSENYEIPQ